jgi:hypothetical protein
MFEDDRDGAGGRSAKKVTGPITDTRLVVRKCKVCEWQGEIIERRGQPSDCPWCYGPTELADVPASVFVDSPGQKNPHAAALGRLGGLKGGAARAAVLSARQRREIAMKAARARWSKRKPAK